MNIEIWQYRASYFGGHWVLAAQLDGEWTPIRHFVFQDQAEKAATWLIELLPDLKVRIHYL